jgi:ubiquinone/menaquinone biosynthesis C-methylase UbiE
VTTNCEVYDRPEVAAFYRRDEQLQEAEKYLFGRYIAPGSNVIDIGVGGGRTTEALSRSARSYLGVDYAPAMVAMCRDRFPQLRFEVADATNLSHIVDDAFDATVFSANGIDAIQTDAERMQCLRELRRITRPSGCIILSSHNAKVLVVRPDFRGARWPLWRVIHAVRKTIQITARSLRTRAFYAGEGYVKDQGLWGMMNYYSTPEVITRDAEAAGLRVLQYTDFRMASRSRYLIPWYYYVLAKNV